MATMFSRVPSPVRARAAPRRAVRPGASSSRFSRFPRVAASADASPADASPPKVVILGAGVAGLQAVATARRLGAVVYVSDIRPAVKEQVESLGARFIEPPELEDKPAESGGYAKQASDAFLAAQRQLLHRASHALLHRRDIRML